MDAEEIAGLLVNSNKGITPERIVKLKACAQRAGVPIGDVVNAIPDEQQRAQVRDMVGNA